MSTRQPLQLSESYRLKKMAKLGAFGGSLLDIGCCQLPNGFLRNSHVVGVDKHAGELPDNYSEFYLGDFTELAHRPERYDVVTAGEVIEHVERPIDFLRDCHSMLTAGGALVLSTPNPHSIFETFLNITLNEKYFYTSDHIMLFPQRWLKRMLRLAGFFRVELYSGGIPLPVVGLVPFPRPWCHQTIARAWKA